jgi:acetyl-CoA carboxylase alpha subunit
MAITTHPITGVSLNVIDVQRKSLTEDEAITAVILRHQGDPYHVIAQKLGTNTHRLGEVYRGETHPGAMGKALDLLTR